MQGSTNPSGHTPLLKSKFFYLLCSIILYVIATAIYTDNKISGYISSGVFSLIILFCVYPHLKNFKIIFILMSLAIGILALHWVVIFQGQLESLFIALYAIIICFLSIILYTVIHSVMLHKRITIDSLLGAVCGYFLLGFVWTFVYLLVGEANHHAFTISALSGSIHDRAQHFFYFSFTTLTTLGYGDILPLSYFARTCSWLEATTGQIYLAVWISQLVALLIIPLFQLKN